MTSWWVNGPWIEGLTCWVGTRTLWAAGPHAWNGISLGHRVLLREGWMGGMGGMGRMGGTEHAA